MLDVNILQRIHNTVEQYPDNIALEIASSRWTYRQLWDIAGRIASEVMRLENPSLAPIAIFASRSLSTYAGILGALRAGRAYLPLNLKFPHSRTVEMLKAVDCSIAIVGKEFREYFQNFAASSEYPVDVINMTDKSDAVQAMIGPENEVYNRTSDISSFTPAGWSQIAYVMFTSGTTGKPKGISVSHQNLDAYVDYLLKSNDFTAKDRFSQTFDTTFDLSVHDLFICWSVGGCLCPLSATDLVLPNKFIVEKELTVWFSVPSIAIRMKQVRMLKENSFPRLRYSAFCGEALPIHVAEAWEAASPNSKVINLYGPTEATISIAEHTWDGTNSIRQSANGIVPIGRVFPTHRYRIVDEDMNPVKEGVRGELILAGPQVTSGYFNNEEKTKEQFVSLDEHTEELWYRTGDSVRELKSGTLQFFGRVDHQVQIRGFRVEIGEVEAAIRQVPGVVESAVVAIFDENGLATGLHAYVLLSDTRTEASEILQYCVKMLPDYMVPAKVLFVNQFPLNSNGKIDRKALVKENTTNEP